MNDVIQQDRADAARRSMAHLPTQALSAPIHHSSSGAIARPILQATPPLPLRPPASEHAAVPLEELGRVVDREASLERFKKFARGRKLSVAKAKTAGATFANASTEAAWEAWKHQEDERGEDESQVVVELHEQLAAAKHVLHALEFQRLQTPAGASPAEDLTFVVKRLALALHQHAPSSPLPEQAVMLLSRRGLIPGRINLGAASK
ncbi:hypothetical protein [Achromobacter anxifer]|uniref:hypothetical protein n=1 Tax=Achromobacter anxifer TaxID=1287737 RepID=UPI0023F7035B|nr:hypothetical protein [Achromobacter anxifer]